MTSPYFKFVKQESSESFYQASLLLPEKKHLLTWALFSFWSELNPLYFWSSKEIPQRFLQRWKGKLFFGETYNSSEEENTIAEQAWIDLQGLFMPSTKQIVLDVLNSLESSIGALRFPTFNDLEFYLKSCGGSMALASAQIIFAEEIEKGSIEFLEPIYYLGAGLLWWKLLQKTAFLVEEGKLFIPLEDLCNFNCSEEDLLAQMPSTKMADLTKFELQKVLEALKFSKKNANIYPKGLKEALTFLSNYFSEEIHSALRIGWQLSSQEIISKKSNWFINGLTSLHKKSLAK